jgi:predicted O-linked N-acetylglucosamine transferase (SPINDLY family)
MERAFDRFIDARGMPDREIVQLARNMELDIAIDLAGFTQGSRPNLFALRVAPLQVSYLGYLGTMGARYMDYLIADETIVPRESQHHYAEKIVYLPSYQANDSWRLTSDRQFSREELGLPRTGFVFCCVNAAYKILPETFDSWMRILRRVEDSVLFLVADNATVQRNLRREAINRGVAEGRLVFGRRLPNPEYLSRFRTADLFLDTLPYNAGTTASDALWAGLPVLTRMGESFSARVAASLLHAIGLPDLVTTTEAQYEATAVTLAREPARLTALKDRLCRNRLAMSLFDTAQFTVHLENAYTQMYERYHANCNPEHIRFSQGQ